jgi:hypothetical protein
VRSRSAGVVLGPRHSRKTVAQRREQARARGRATISVKRGRSRAHRAPGLPDQDVDKSPPSPGRVCRPWRAGWIVDEGVARLELTGAAGSRAALVPDHSSRAARRAVRDACASGVLPKPGGPWKSM